MFGDGGSGLVPPQIYLHLTGHQVGSVYKLQSPFVCVFVCPLPTNKLMGRLEISGQRAYFKKCQTIRNYTHSSRGGLPYAGFLCLTQPFKIQVGILVPQSIYYNVRPEVLINGPCIIISVFSIVGQPLLAFNVIESLEKNAWK